MKFVRLASLAFAWIMFQLLFSGCTTVGRAALDNPDIREFTLADARRAAEIAALDPTDRLGQTCWAAVVAALAKKEAKPPSASALPESIGALSSYAHVRYLRRNIQADAKEDLVPPEVHDACVGMIGDSVVAVRKLTFRALFSVVR